MQWFPTYSGSLSALLVTSTRAGARCRGIAVVITLTVNRRLNPAPFPRLTTVLPAAAWVQGGATMSIIGTGNKH